MQVTAWRTWQWMIIGTLAGAAVGYAWTNLPNDLERTGDKNQFRNLVMRSNAAITRGQPPLVRKVVVFEPERDPSDVLVYPVRFEYVQPTRPRSLDQVLKMAAAGKNAPATPPPELAYTASGIYAPTPFFKEQSITEFLTNNKVPFTDRSGGGKYVPMYYGAAGGFVLIGVLWPAAIGLMIRAGLAKAPPPRPQKEKFKHRTGEDVDDMLVKPEEKKPADPGALDALNDAMEASLAATLQAGGPRPTTPTPAAAPLNTYVSGSSAGASDPTERPAPPAPEEKKDYGGEYYPVAKTSKKPDEHH